MRNLFFCDPIPPKPESGLYGPILGVCGDCSLKGDLDHLGLALYANNRY
jgi:hypothetical protein